VWPATLALLTCLCIDFSNPLLPGVVRFGEEDSIHALRAERSRTGERPARTVPDTLEPARFVHDDMPVLRPAPGSLGRFRLPAGAGRPRGAIDAVRPAAAALDDG
jgi:hypothetical protein